MPRYLFLMRHARHQEGSLTEEGSAHVRSLALRLCEWIQAEWRNHPTRVIRSWTTSSATEVQQTADQLTGDVLAGIRRGDGQAEPYPFAGLAAALVPTSVTGGLGLDQELSAYSPDEQAFEQLCAWLEASGTGNERARRT